MVIQCKQTLNKMPFFPLFFFKLRTFTEKIPETEKDLFRDVGLLYMLNHCFVKNKYCLEVLLCVLTIIFWSKFG